MKFSIPLSSVLAVSLLSNFTTAKSFKNTAPLLISTNGLSSNVDSKYIDSFANVSRKIKSFTDNLCSEDSESQIALIKIHGLDESDITDDFLNNFEFRNIDLISNHVVYKSSDDHSRDYFADSCKYAGFVNSKEFESESEINWNEKYLTQQTNVIIALYADKTNNSRLFKDLKSISSILDSHTLIVQGVPSFEEPPNSIIGSTSQKLKKLIKNNNNSKRDEINYELIKEELEESFQEVSEAVYDEFSEIDDLTSDEEFHQNTEIKAESTVVTGSLFDKYSFFSNGIWMGTIIFLFLAWLLSIALSWLNSLQISYAAFEKPFDFEKKLQ